MFITDLLNAPLAALTALRHRIHIDLDAARQLEPDNDELEKLARLGKASLATLGEVYDRCGLPTALWALSASRQDEDSYRVLSILIAREALRQADTMDEETHVWLTQMVNALGPGLRNAQDVWEHLAAHLKTLEDDEAPDMSVKESGIRMVMAVLARPHLPENSDWAVRDWQCNPSYCLTLARQLRVRANQATQAARSLVLAARQAQKRWQDGTSLKFDFLADDLDDHYWRIEEELTEHLTPLVDGDIAVALGLETEV